MKITVITVSYNSARTIADTVRSVASQTYRNFEHLVIDGQSSDNTASVVQINHHVRLLFSSEPDGGIYDAMNKGLGRATGDVIGFLNADDFYADNGVLEKIAATFFDASVEACYGDLVYVTPDNSRVVRYWKSKPFTRGDFAKGWCPAHPTFYIRKSALQRFGLFDLTFNLAADFEFMVRYLESNAVNSVYIPHVLVHMRLGGATNQSYSNVWKQNKEIFIALQKNKITFRTLDFITNKLLNRISQYILARLNRLRPKAQV